jgi:uncharacterized membrane protein required for colicin V production
MSWFDVAALVVVVLAVLDGATSGFAWAVMELVVLLGSAAAARALRPHAEPYLQKIAALPPSDLPWVTHLLVFALCACSLFGVLLLVHPAAKKWRFRNDRWFGGALGLLNGCLAAVLVSSMVIAATDPAWEAEARSSRVVRVVGSLAAGPASVLLPEHAAGRSRQLAGE